MLSTSLKATVICMLGLALLLKPHISIADANDSVTAATQTPPLSVTLSPQSPIDEVLIEQASIDVIAARMTRFALRNFSALPHIRFRFEESSPFPANIWLSDETVYEVSLSFPFLYRMKQSINQQYPEQYELQSKIYQASVERMMWQELGRALIHSIPVQAYDHDAYLLDSFTTLMLLQQYHEETDFLLDASEAYLKIDETTPSMLPPDISDEVAFDDERYKRIVCLILGKDYSSQLELNGGPYLKLLDELTWDRRNLERCHQLFLKQTKRWARLLQPVLREDSSITALADAITSNHQR